MPIAINDWVVYRRFVTLRLGSLNQVEHEGLLCEGFRMPARGDLSARAEGRRPKASQEGTRGGRVTGCRTMGI
jgi:hypothetical protein